MELFDHIRPYRNDEVQDVLSKIIQDPELISTLAKYNFPILHGLLRSSLNYFIKRSLKKKITSINTVKKFQEILIKPYMQKMIRQTTTSINWRGLENLDKKKPSLFLSNHRDIVLDPALVNYGLHLNEQDTVHIAIGDNLLEKPFVSDLMRLNKSFIVKRSISSFKKKLTELKILSAYIKHMIASDNSIWLAHREGRAKDGNDFTDIAIIKMLYFSFKPVSFAEMLTHLNIVPVAISYEVNPCDYLHARELYYKEKQDNYVKDEFEDLHNIIQGIKEKKGCVHVAFGKPLNNLFDASQCVAEIDRQIHNLYHLFPINYAAYNILNRQALADYNYINSWHNTFTAQEIEQGEQLLKNRLQKCEKRMRQWLIKIYANPVKNFLISC